MIKAYTTYGIGTDVINPTYMNISKSEFYLTTLKQTGNQIRDAVSVAFEPSNSNTSVTWSIFPESVATLEPAPEDLIKDKFTNRIEI